MSNKLEYLEATCPECGKEMEVEIPEGVYAITVPNYNPEVEKFNEINISINLNKGIIEELYFISGNLKGWRNKKARGMVKNRIIGLEELVYKLEPEQYRLYNTINPPIGERSID